jgi:hypothetical protein
MCNQNRRYPCIFIFVQLLVLYWQIFEGHAREVVNVADDLQHFSLTVFNCIWFYSFMPTVLFALTCSDYLYLSSNIFAISSFLVRIRKLAFWLAITVSYDSLIELLRRVSDSPQLSGGVACSAKFVFLMVSDLVICCLMCCALLDLAFQNHMLGRLDSLFFTFCHVSNTFYNLRPIWALFIDNVWAAADSFIGLDNFYELAFEKIIHLRILKAWWRFESVGGINFRNLLFVIVLRLYALWEFMLTTVLVDFFAEFKLVAGFNLLTWAVIRF